MCIESWPNASWASVLTALYAGGRTAEYAEGKGVNRNEGDRD